VFIKLYKKKNEVVFKITINWACDLSNDNFNQIIILKATPFFYRHALNIH